MAIVNESYMPPFALLVLDGDDNKWKVYKGLETEEFDKEAFLSSANTQEFPNGTYTNNYIDAKVVPNENLDSYLSEDVDVGTDSHTETLSLSLEMIRHKDTAEFNFNVDIDDVGQIVFTPVDTAVSFTDIHKMTAEESITDTVEENIRRLTVSLDANMISEDSNFSYFCDIDDVGQAVVTPESETTSFLTVSINDSLNLVTECNEAVEVSEAIDPSTDKFKTRKELCLAIIDDLEESLKQVITKVQKIEKEFNVIGVHAADIDSYMTRYLEKFIEDREGEVSVAEFRRRLEAYEASSEETDVQEGLSTLVLEDADNIDREAIINNFMRGDITIFSDDGNPEEGLIHIHELDSNVRNLTYEYYYDPESGAIVSYARDRKDKQ